MKDERQRRAASEGKGRVGETVPPPGRVVAAELFFEVRSAEDEGGRPAVGTGRGHVARFAMGEKRFDLRRTQRISRLDRSAARGHVGQFLQHLARSRRGLACDGPCQEVAKRPLRVRAFQERRKRVDADRARAERFDLDAEMRERLAVGLDRGHLRIRQVHRDGGEAPLAFERTGFEAAHELLEEDAFVQGVLVHDEDAVRRLGDEVGVVKLNGGSRRRGVRSRGFIPTSSGFIPGL